MSATLVTCHCNHCSGHIEFASEGAGQSIVCPHCGIETVLYVPQVPTPPTISPRFRIPYSTLKPFIIIASAAIVLAVIAGFIGERIMTVLGVALSGIVGAALIVGAAIVGALIFIWFVLWVIFPVFVYYGLKRMENLLEEIERNTRQP